MITFVDEKGTEHSALVAYSVTNAVNGELSVKGTIYTNDKVLHGIGRGWRFRLDDEYFRITYAKPNDTGRQIEVEFDAVHQFFYDMSKSMVYTTSNGSKPFETYLQAIFSNSGYTYNLETTVGSIRKENFGNKSRLSLFNDIIKAAGLEFSVRGHVVRILKQIGTDLSAIVRKDFNMNELKIEKNINSFVTYQRGLGAWKDDEDHSKGRYETSYESPLSAIYGRIEADPVVDERYKDTGQLLERLKENVDKSYKVSVEIDMEDLSRAGYRISHPNPGDYIMAINGTLGFRQKVRIVSFTSEYDVGGKLISQKVVCNDIGTVQRATSEISHLSRTLTDSIEGSERALKTATRALVSADGKNTNYFGDVKPLDVPKGTLRKGDRLFLTVGDKKQLYFWNGAEWEFEPTEFDHEKFDMEFNRKSQEIKKVIQENRQKAEEALRNAGASSLLAQEAKRIGLDSVAKLEEFKGQATRAQTALSGDLDSLKRTIANDIRPKQAQAEAEIAKQVKALGQTRDELLGIKSAQATHEETTTRRLSELTNLANGKASKSELTQTAEELASRIASVQVGGINLLRNTASLLIGDRSKGYWMSASGGNGRAISVEVLDPPQKMIKKMIRVIENTNGGNKDLTQLVRLRVGEKYTISCYARVASDSSHANVNLLFRSWANNTDLNRKFQKSISHKNWQKYSFTFTADAIENSIQFGQSGAGIIEICAPKIESGTLATDYSEDPEDIENQISALESTFKQRADSIEAGVNRLTEGLRIKADISLLNVTAENIRQSVKSLETDTRDKLDQKLSLAEFEVRAGSIRQEILNATKDKADKTLVIAEAGKIREEFSKTKVGSRNYAEDYDFSRGLWRYHQGDSSPVDWKIINGEYHVKGTTKIWKQMQIFSKEGSRVSEKNSTALLELEIGETYTLSFQGICYSGSPNVWVSLRANRTISGNPEIINGNFNLTSSWKTYQVTVPALTKPDNFDFWRIILGYNEIGHVAFRKVELTRSSTRIDAGPAPEDGKTDLVVAKSEFQKTAEGLSTKLAAVETYVNQDDQRQEALRRYTREESAKQAKAVREQISRDYVGKSRYQEDVRGIERRFEAITNPQNGSIATQIATYRNAVDGRFAEITSMISGKANQTDFQRVRETSQLYERILGNSENGIANNVARMALTSRLFQIEVAKNVGDGRNYVKNADFREGSKNWKETNISGLNFNYEHSLKNRGKTGIHIYGSAGTTEFYGIHQTYKFEGSKNDNVILSFLASKDGANDFSGIRIGVHCRKNNAIISQMWRTIPNSEITGYSYKKIILTFNLPVDVDELNLMIFGERDKTINLYISEIKFEKGSTATPFTLAPEDTDEAIRTVQSQLADSWSVQNLTSAGSIVSQINATNNQILIEAEKIRLKGKTLLDELTAIQGYFKLLFVGEGSFAKLNAEIIGANSITADKLVMDIAMARRFVSSDILTDMLAAKEAFINKLRSVVVTATLLEGYKGRIGGFQIGTHEKDSSVYWITGQNQFSVGMSNGSGQWSQTALWVNWGNNWGFPGDYAWYVKNNGKMYCYNTAEFWNTPVIHGNLRVTGHIYYNNENSGKTGHWIHSSKYSNFEPSNNYLYLYYSGSGYDWIPMNKEISDRRYKDNIEASTVSGLDVINNLKTYSYRKQYDGRIEDISCGIMAQDVQKYAPEAFFENPDGAYSYNTFALVPYLIKAIQELNHKIEKLEKT